MRRIAGILLFGLAAAISFYAHFQKISEKYTEKVKEGKIEVGAPGIIVNGDRCSEVSAMAGRFVKIKATVKRVKGREIITGCLKVILRFKKRIPVEPGDRISLSGFIKSKRGLFYIDIWDENDIYIETGRT